MMIPEISRSKAGIGGPVFDGLDLGNLSAMSPSSLIKTIKHSPGDYHGEGKIYHDDHGTKVKYRRPQSLEWTEEMSQVLLDTNYQGKS